MFNGILSLYIYKEYFKTLFSVFVIFCFLFLFSNFFDNINKFRAFDLSIVYFIKISILKIPYLINEISPLISLISGVLFLENLSSSNQILSIFSFGRSILSILIPMLAVNIFFAFVMLFAFCHYGNIMLAQYDEINDKLLHGINPDIRITDRSIAASEFYENKQRIIVSNKIDIPESKLLNPIIIVIDVDNSKIIFRLDPEYITIQNHVIIPSDYEKIYGDSVSAKNQMLTRFSIRDISSSLIPPENISIFEINTLAEKYKRLGIPHSIYKNYYYKQIFKPIITVSTSLIAFALVNLRNAGLRSGKKIAKNLILSGILYSIYTLLSQILGYKIDSDIFRTVIPMLFICVVFLLNFLLIYVKL